MLVIFTKRAQQDWRKLDRNVQNQLRKKLLFYLNSGKALNFADVLVDTDLGEYRFRIGDYRIIFDFENDTIIVLRVGHRKDIYK